MPSDTQNGLRRRERNCRYAGCHRCSARPCHNAAAASQGLRLEAHQAVARPKEGAKSRAGRAVPGGAPRLRRGADGLHVYTKNAVLAEMRRTEGVLGVVLFASWPSRQVERVRLLAGGKVPRLERK